MAHEKEKTRFIELIALPTVGICDSESDAERFFQPGGTPFTAQVLRKYIEARAIGSLGLGQVRKEMVSVRTLFIAMDNLAAAAKVAKNPFEPDVKEAAFFWNMGPLVKKGLAHIDTKHKATAMPEDLTTFIRKLFERDIAADMGTTRDLLLIALYVCLQVDSSSRVSELLLPTIGSTEETEQYKRENPLKCFEWICIEPHAFRNETAGELGRAGKVTLKAILNFRDLKAPRGQGATSRGGYQAKVEKKIPLRLLPPSRVAEDSLFLLVTLGLIDQVFEGITSWQDIERLQPGENGLRIAIKANMERVPVRIP